MVTGSMHYQGSNQQNHQTATEKMPHEWCPALGGLNPSVISGGSVAAANANWCNFVRPDGTIIMLGNTEGVYSGVTGGWRCVNWRA